MFFHTSCWLLQQFLEVLLSTAEGMPILHDLRLTSLSCGVLQGNCFHNRTHAWHTACVCRAHSEVGCPRTESGTSISSVPAFRIAPSPAERLRLCLCLCGGCSLEWGCFWVRELSLLKKGRSRSLYPYSFGSLRWGWKIGLVDRCVCACVKTRRHGLMIFKIRPRDKSHLQEHTRKTYTTYMHFLDTPARPGDFHLYITWFTLVHQSVLDLVLWEVMLGIFISLLLSTTATALWPKPRLVTQLDECCGRTGCMSLHLCEETDQHAADAVQDKSWCWWSPCSQDIS